MESTYNTLPIKAILSLEPLHQYIANSIQFTFSQLGFSQHFKKDFQALLSTLDVRRFREKHQKEISEIYQERFYRHLVPKYYQEHIFPALRHLQEAPNRHHPISQNRHNRPIKRVLDYGCGSGELAYHLSTLQPQLTLNAIDIAHYPSWDQYQSRHLTFQQFIPDQLQATLGALAPDVVICSWVLHHMSEQQQRALLNALQKRASVNTHAFPKLIILEDSYSDSLPPEHWSHSAAEFKALTPIDKRKILYAFDWLANIVLSGRYSINMPDTYRSVEQWCELFREYGFQERLINNIGVPENRDMGNPQAVMVFEPI